jgi:GR25 family glycosyltransferase involved in LPS biosynthesis
MDINEITNINKYMKCIDIIYWINLDRSVDRRNNMINMLKNINIPNNRVSGVNGKALSHDKIASRIQNIDNLSTPSEYGCLLSHLDTIKTFADSNYKNALIFEDDVTLEYCKYWNKSLCEIMQNAPQDWDIIMLNYIRWYPLEDTYTLNVDGNISGCQAYIINKKGAQKLMNEIYVDNDTYKLNTNYRQTADDYIYASLKTYVYKYPYFTYSITNDSTIHESHLDYHNYAKIIGLLEWKKIYKFKLKPEYRKIFDDMSPYDYNKRFIKFMVIFILCIIFVILCYS